MDERTCIFRNSAVFIKAKVKENICTTAILLLYILHKIAFLIAVHCIAVMGEVFRIRPGRRRGLPGLPYNGQWFSFPGTKRPHLSARLPLDLFPWNSILNVLWKSVEQIADLFKIRQKYGALYVKTSPYVLLLPATLIRHKALLCDTHNFCMVVSEIISITHFLRFHCSSG